MSSSARAEQKWATPGGASHSTTADRTRCIDFGVTDRETPRQPDRHEVVTHVLGSDLRGQGADPLRPDRFEQHVVPVEIEKLLLTACERANIDGSGRIDPHSLKRGMMCNW
jgi:hypothetical protein